MSNFLLSTPERGVEELRKLLPDTFVLDGKRVNDFSRIELKQWLKCNNIT